MIKALRWLLVIFTLVSLYGTSGMARADELVVPLYQATYSIGRNDFRIGDASFSLTQNQDGTYTYTSVSKAAGLVSLFVSDVVTETSRFKVMDGELQSLQYTYEHTGNDKDKKENIRFDWDKHVAHSNEGGKQHTLPLTAGTYDRLLAQLAVSVNLEAGKTVGEYRVLDHNEISIYHMQPQGDTDLKTPAGEYKVIDMVRKVPKKNRVTTFWLAPKLDYLPVQMQQTEPGKATISLVLTDITFGTSRAGK